MIRCTLLLGAMCALLGVLTGCGASSSQIGLGTATSTVPAAAIASPTVPKLMPSNVPLGWQIYGGPHFAIAYPPDWTFSSTAAAGGPPNGADVTYRFAAPSGGGNVTVNEQDGWDAATIQKDFCPQRAAPVTVGNLTWWYSTAEGGVLRNWMFVTDRGTIYGMGTNDGIASQTVQQQDAAVMATFHAEYTAAGCA
jgi:hypothetical protein